MKWVGKIKFDMAYGFIKRWMKEDAVIFVSFWTSFVFDAKLDLNST